MTLLRRFVLFAALAPVLAGCGRTLPLRADDRWYSVYALQIPDTDLKLELAHARAGERGCRSADGSRTSVRVVALAPFPDYAALPDTLAAAPTVDDGVPLAARDTGPLDLSLDGATRVVPLYTGKELLVRTNDACAALHLRALR